MLSITLETTWVPVLSHVQLSLRHRLTCSYKYVNNAKKPHEYLYCLTISSPWDTDWPAATNTSRRSRHQLDPSRDTNFSRNIYCKPFSGMCTEVEIIEYVKFIVVKCKLKFSLLWKINQAGVDPSLKKIWAKLILSHFHLIYFASHYACTYTGPSYSYLLYN